MTEEPFRDGCPVQGDHMLRATQEACPACKPFSLWDAVDEGKLHRLPDGSVRLKARDGRWKGCEFRMYRPDELFQFGDVWYEPRPPAPRPDGKGKMLTNFWGLWLTDRRPWTQEELPFKELTGAERYLADRLKDPEYRAAYEAASPRG